MTGPTTRRGLMGAALAGVAVGGAAPLLAPDHPDAALLTLCTAFEATQRRINGVWQWRVEGGHVRGPNYIEDEHEREAFVSALEEGQTDLVDQICDHSPTTVDGFRAIARCMVLYDGEMRDGVSGDGRDYGMHSYTIDNLLLGMMVGLQVDDITDATCMDGPAVLAVEQDA